MKAGKRKRKSVLIVQGGWDGHEPLLCANRFGDWLQEKGYRVVISDTLDIFTNRRKMRNFDLIIPAWTMGTMTADQWSGFKRAVLDGGAGVAGWHGGMCDAFRENVEYQFMTGGQWVAHPGNIFKYTVNISKSDDPIMKGVKDFSITSEQYYLHVDPSNEVLATTTFSGRQGDCPWIKGTVMPYVWKRTYGKSRIFYSALGHVNADFDVPEVLEITKRGIQWALRERIKPEYTSP